MRYALTFITAALACLLGGEALGIGMGITHDFSLVPVHAHLNLLGWATLALYGLIHRAYPSLASSRLARTQCYLAIVASVVMPIGIAVAGLTGNPVLAIVASLAVISATAMFALMFVRKARA